MDFSSICRTCLATKCLSPIFKKGVDSDRFSATIFITTGLQVNINDGLPQKMCKTCMKFLKDILRFRHSCKRAEIKLLDIENSQNDHENALKGFVIKKPPHKRKISTAVKSKHTVYSIKVESDFENDDDIPLLQQKLRFSKQKVDKESLKIDDIDQITDEILKNLENNENKHKLHDLFIDDVKSDEKTSDPDSQLADSQESDINELKINNESINDDKTNLQTLQLEDNTIDQYKFDTEFQDIHFDSDSDKQMVMTDYDVEIPKYEKDILKNETETSKSNMESSKKELRLSECNTSVPNHKREISEDNENYPINFTKIRKCELKNKQPNKNSLLISNIDIKIKENSHNESKSVEGDKNFKTDTENRLFLKKDKYRVTCNLCQKDLSKRSISSHIVNSHPGADTRKVKCELCDTYVLKQRLVRHKIVMHGVDCFRCGYCKTEFESKDILIDHVSTCTEKKRKRKPQTDKRREVIVECDICKKSMQKSSLRMHKEIKHAGMGPVCEHCGRRFGNKNRLSEHLRAKHGYEKFKCSMCDFLSASSVAMKNHERRHRGEKPYVCDQCGAKFHARHLLAQHKQSHRTEKNMKCDQCPAAFKANNTLHMHKMTCHNKNTYQCPMCPRTYNSRHYAVKHLRNVHHHTGVVGPLVAGPKEPKIATGAQKVMRVIRVKPKEPIPKEPKEPIRYMTCTVTAGP